MSAITLLPMTLAIVGTGVFIWPYLSNSGRITAELAFGGFVAITILAISVGLCLLTIHNLLTSVESSSAWGRFLRLEGLIILLSFLLSVIPAFLTDEDGYYAWQHESSYLTSNMRVRNAGDYSKSRDGVAIPFLLPIFAISMIVSNLVALPIAVSDFTLSLTGDRAQALGLGVAVLFGLPFAVTGLMMIAEEW